MPKEQSIQNILDDARMQMDKAISHLRSELNTIRTGRATPAMLEGLQVDYYGSQTPITQVANISAPQADLILVQPYDRNALEDIEKAILSANTGMNPSNDGTTIRIPVPSLSEERRKELAQMARTRGEETKIAVRNIRRGIKDEIKGLQQSENLSEDVRYSAEEELQEITDKYTDKVDTLLDKKEKAIMEV